MHKCRTLTVVLLALYSQASVRVERGSLIQRKPSPCVSGYNFKVRDVVLCPLSLGLSSAFSVTPAAGVFLRHSPVTSSPSGWFGRHHTMAVLIPGLPPEYYLSLNPSTSGALSQADPPALLLLC